MYSKTQNIIFWLCSVADIFKCGKPATHRNKHTAIIQWQQCLTWPKSLWSDIVNFTNSWHRNILYCIIHFRKVIRFRELPTRTTNERGLEVAEMRFLRYAANYAVWNKKSSNRMRSQLVMRHLSKYKIHERKNNWLDYLQRMPSEGAPEQNLYYQMAGRRGPER
jgi:hypothetical protein